MLHKRNRDSYYFCYSFRLRLRLSRTYTYRLNQLFSQGATRSRALTCVNIN
jgi:hypothetical protein